MSIKINLFTFILIIFTSVIESKVAIDDCLWNLLCYRLQLALLEVLETMVILKKCRDEISKKTIQHYFYKAEISAQIR